MTDFDQLIADIEQEARDEGPAAVAELETYRDRFRLASEILTLRREQNLTQKQLAERAGLQQADISRIERGEIAPTGPTFGKLAKALNVSFGFYRRVDHNVVEPISTTPPSHVALPARRPAKGGSRKASPQRSRSAKR